MIREELIYFLDKGALAHIDFGITRSELIKKLGATTWLHYSNRRDKLPSIYKYGRIEFYFMKDRPDEGLSGIMYQPATRKADNAFLRCKYNNWNEKLDIETAIDYLVLNNINFTEIQYKNESDFRKLVTESNVNIYFDCQDEQGHFILNKLGKFIGF